MKATGIVRRIDDLGRVVIPKEIRRTMRIREGDPLEIYTDRDGEVIFKKYSPIGELSSFASQYAEAVSRTGGFPVLVTDRDAIIAVHGISKKDYLEKPISAEIERIIENRTTFSAEHEPPVLVTDAPIRATVVSPIIAEGDVIGSVIILGEEGRKVTEVEIKLAQAAAAFLGRQLEP